MLSIWSNQAAGPRPEVNIVSVTAISPGRLQVVTPEVESSLSRHPALSELAEPGSSACIVYGPDDFLRDRDEFVALMWIAGNSLLRVGGDDAGEDIISVLDLLSFPFRVRSFYGDDYTAGTRLGPAPVFLELTEKTRAFVQQRELQQSVAWLKAAAPGYFPGASFDLESVEGEDDSEDALALRVYASFPTTEFSERRHRMCEAMADAGHKQLRDLIGVFQRRIPGRGWQALPWYRSISKR